MTHPDGELSFFNDAAFGISPALTQLKKYTESLGGVFSEDKGSNLHVNFMSESGYCAVEIANGDKVIIDLGEIGSEYRPGHAHADTLSFEKSIGGQRFLADSEIVSVQARCMGDVPSVQVAEDKAAITFGFAHGSFGTIHYFANGASNFPKERVEVFTAGRVLQLDNFRKLKGFGWTGFSKMNLWTQDKGQKACAAAFVAAITEGKPSPIPFDEIIEVSRVTIDIAHSLRS